MQCSGDKKTDPSINKQTTVIIFNWWVLVIQRAFFMAFIAALLHKNMREFVAFLHYMCVKLFVFRLNFQE